MSATRNEPSPASGGPGTPVPAPIPGTAGPGTSSGRKLSEALGFGSLPSSPTVVPLPGAGPAREPRRAFAGPLSRVEEAFGVMPDDVVASSGSKPAASAPSGDEMVRVPAGKFAYGEDKRVVAVPEFEIDRDPVSNGDYERYVQATGHRPPLYWRSGRCPDELRDHPVVGVDFFDAIAYARWAGKDLPFEDEWERAARGVQARIYPWGDEPDLCANTARTGMKSTLPIGFFRKNVSPDGCREMVGNTWEITHSPAPGGGVVVRGGSWFDFALYAKTFFRSSARPDARNGTIGFRCVRRPASRPDAARAISDGEIEVGIAGRKSKGELPDPSAWSADRRDLVPDVRRLRMIVASHDEELAAEPRPGASSGPSKPAVRKAFTPPATPSVGAVPAIPSVTPASPTATPPRPAFTPAASAPSVPATPATAPRPTPVPFPTAASAPPPPSPATPARPPLVGPPGRLPVAPYNPLATPGPVTTPPVPAPTVASRPAAAMPLSPSLAGTSSPSSFGPSPAAGAPITTPRPFVPTPPPTPSTTAPIAGPTVPSKSAPTPAPLAATPLAPRPAFPPPTMIPAPVVVPIKPLLLPIPSPTPAATATPIAAAAPASPFAIKPTSPVTPTPSAITPIATASKPPTAPTPTPTSTPSPFASKPVESSALKPTPTAPSPLAASTSGASSIPPPATKPSAPPASPPKPAESARPAPTYATSVSPRPTTAPVAAGATASSTSFAQAAAEAQRAVLTPTTTSSSEQDEESASPLRFALVVIGFLAATVLAVVAILNAGKGTDDLEDDGARLGLPDLVADASDAAFPKVLSAGAVQPDTSSLDKGVVLAVFSDGSSGAGTQTARLAAEMHRRLRPYHVRTVLVLPRESVTSEAAPDAAALKEKLAALDVDGDVSVLLDPPDDRASSHLRRVRWQVADGNAAIVLRDGVETMRVAPASPSSGLVRAQLAPLVKTAATLGNLRSEGDEPSEDEDTGESTGRRAEGSDSGAATSPPAPPADPPEANPPK